MTINPLRGAKFGAGSGLCFAIVMPINNWLQHKQTTFGSLIVGAMFVFLFFGLIGTFTDKIESDIGDP